MVKKKGSSSLLDAEHLDLAIDNATSEISGFLKVSRKTRKPYLLLLDEETNKF